MAIITGQTTHGNCLPVHYLENNSYECAPDVGELHRKHKIYNNYHMFYAKITGFIGEVVNIRLKWPVFDPEAVSDEYKAWASYSVDWPPFFHAVKETLYYSSDELVWNHVENAREDGNDVLFSVVLTSEVCYISNILHYTHASFDNLIREASASRDVQAFSLGRAWDGSELMTFVCTDFDVPAEKKLNVYLQAAQHCNEHPGCHVLDYMVRYLASGSEDVRKILKKFIFRITPVVDKAGWRWGLQINPGRVSNIEFNYNRDWVAFTLPETRAISNYLEKIRDDGGRFLLLADLHGGTGNEDDYQSGAGVSVDNTRGDAFRKAQEKFVDLIRENCDYIDPAEKGYAYEGSLDTMFDGYAKNRFGMGFTFEISMSKIWDRAAGRRFPNSQAAFKRFARQLVTVIDKYADAIHSV